MSQVDDQAQPPANSFRFPLKVVDSALIIAILLAVLNYAGWTYRQAYLKHFSIDPSSLDSSSISIAVDGVGAIGTTFLAWLAASVFLLVSGICMWGVVWFVERKRGNRGPLADQTAIMMAQASGIAFAFLFVIWGGSIAGRWAAEEQIVNIKAGDVWTYHVKGKVIAAVPIAQGSTTTWLLTKAGIRPISTTDIEMIDGPRFDKLIKTNNSSFRR